MRVLLVRTDRMGDVILSAPVATLLKAAHPEWAIDFLVRPALVPLAAMHKDVDQVVSYDRDGEGPFELARHIRDRDYDVAVVLHPEPGLALALWWARVPRRIGTRYRAYSFLFNEKVPVHRKRSGRHELELNLETAAPLAPAPADSVADLFRFRVPKEAEERVRLKLARFGVEPEARPVVLHPGSGGSARDWPVHRFAELAELLHAHGFPQILTTGTVPEKPLIDELVARARVPVVRLDGQLDLAELAALLRNARLVVANSTGPLHLAVAMGTPVVGLYCPIGPCHPRRWGPYGRPDAVVMPDVPECESCSRKCPHFDCMELISAEQVLQKAIEVLEAKPS